MVAQQEVRIPDIGDADDVEVIEIFVAVGAQVSVDDPLIVIESDKASMEVPSSVGGRITKLAVAVGDKVREGQVIATVDVDAAGDVAEEKAPPAPADKTPTPAKKGPPTPKASDAVQRLEVRLPDIGDAKDVVVVEVAVAAGQSVASDDLLMVVESDKASMEITAPVPGRIASVDVKPGDGVDEGTLLAVIESSAEAPAAVASVAAEQESEAPRASAKEQAAEPPDERPTLTPSGAPSIAVYAGPAVRRLARELGVELGKVTGSGPRGRILNADVQAFVKRSLSQPRGSVGGGIPAVPVIDFAKFGPVEAVPLTRIRARGAENLHRSWLNVPHVTQHDDADITELEAFRAELKPEAANQQIKLTPLAFIVRAVVATLQRFPTFNASLDSAGQAMIIKHYFNIGLAVDTPDGLVVPVLHDAERKGVFELAREIERLSTKAQSGKLAISELQGGSFSISSLGGIGGLGFTPIVNAPEVAILGVSRLTTKPVWSGTEFVPRQMLPLSLSYDHRAINGAEAGRFLTSLCQTLGDMRRVLL